MSDEESSSPDQDSRYQVGYGKPPKSNRFPKGESGNPKGRPRGSKNLASIVLRESRQRVRLNGPGGSRTVTKLEASMMQLSNMAAQGDLRAQRELFALVRMSEESTNSDTAPPAMHELDHQVMETIRKRMQTFQSPTPAPKKENPE